MACESGPPPPPIILDLEGDTVVLAQGAVVLDFTVGMVTRDFEPDTARAIAGDVVRIRSLDSGPHAMGFDAASSDTSAIRFLTETGQIRALPLVEPDALWVISLVDAPVGRYVVVCLTHGTSAEVLVTDSRTGRRR